MSYDIRLNRYSEEAAPEQQVDAAVAVLTRYGARLFEGEGRFSARWEDGSGLVMFSKSLSQRPVMFYGLLNPLGDLSQRFCEFTYDFATAIDCAIYPDVIPTLTIVFHTAMVERLPESVRAKTVVCATSVSALRDALAPSYYRWRGMVKDVARELNGLTGDGSAGGA